MSVEQSIEKQQLKVYVKMHDGSRLLGSFYLAPGERLQDVMNDERNFIPLHALNDASKYQMVMLSKRYIEQVEEVVAKDVEDAPNLREKMKLEVDGSWNGIERRREQVSFELDDSLDHPFRRADDRYKS